MTDKNKPTDYKKMSDYDQMKLMLSRTRQGNQKPVVKNKLIKEGTQPALLPQEQEDEETKFKEAVATTVEFGQFMRYDDNVEWSGNLIKEKIKWVYSLDDTNGCYISCEQLQLSDEAVQTIQRLKAYYDTWSEYWGNETGN